MNIIETLVQCLKVNLLSFIVGTTLFKRLENLPCMKVPLKTVSSRSVTMSPISNQLHGTVNLIIINSFYISIYKQTDRCNNFRRR
jgi:hypothetical protein